MFVLPRGQAAPGFGYDVGKGGVLLALHSASLPFVREILSDFNTLDSLVYPFLAITQPPVIGNSLFNRQFWILNLVNTIGWTWAIHCLNGSALGEGIDWMSRNSCS